MVVNYCISSSIRGLDEERDVEVRTGMREKTEGGEGGVGGMMMVMESEERRKGLGAGREEECVGCREGVRGPCAGAAQDEESS